MISSGERATSLLITYKCFLLLLNFFVSLKLLGLLSLNKDLPVAGILELRRDKA